MRRLGLKPCGVAHMEQREPGTSQAATALASSAALRADEGRSSAPAEQAAFHWSAAAAAAPALQAEDEQAHHGSWVQRESGCGCWGLGVLYRVDNEDGLAELEVQSAPSRGSAAIEAWPLTAKKKCWPMVFARPVFLQACDP